MALKINEYEADKPKLNLWIAQREQEIAELKKKLSVTNTTANNAADSATAATGAIPDSVTSPSASESGYIVDGVLFSEVTFTYTSPAVLGDFHGVFVVAKDYRASAELVKVYEHTFAGGPATSASFPVTLQRTGESITFFLVSKTSSGLAREDWGNAPSTSATLDGNASAPTAPTGLGATQQELGVQLSWSANSESNLAGYKLWRHTADVFGSATNISEIGTSRAGSPSYFDKTAGKGTTFFYWITAINTAAQESTESSSANNSGKPVAAADTEFADTTTVEALKPGEVGATLGADWGVDLDNRPTELTDGRVDAALTAATGVVKTDKVAEASIADGAVAVVKLKADSLARIFATQTSRDDTVTGGGRALSNIKSDGLYLGAKFHDSSYEIDTSTNRDANGTEADTTWLDGASFSFIKPAGETTYEDDISVTKIGGTATTWTVEGRIKVNDGSDKFSNITTVNNPDLIELGTAAVTGLSSSRLTVTVTAQIQVTNTDGTLAARSRFSETQASLVRPN